MGRIASIDFGLARLGVAISDEMQIIASTLGALKSEKTMEKTIVALLEKLAIYDLEEIIIGMPLHLDGRMGLLADEVNHFISKLEKVVSCPVTPYDERLSTAQAERALREANMSRKKRSKVVDGVAAALLLQSYLDRKSLTALSLA